MPPKMIARLNSVRSPDCLYYVKSGEDGRLEVWKTELTRGGRKKKIVEEQNEQ